MAFGLAGTISFCIGNMLSSASQGRGIHVLASTSWGMVHGTGFMVLVSLVRGHDFIIDPSISYLGSLAWLIIASSVMTFACYLSLVGRIGPGRAAYATVVFPIFALLISARYEGYDWTLPSFAGMGLVVIGNLMMIRARGRPTGSSTPVFHPCGKGGGASDAAASPIAAPSVSIWRSRIYHAGIKPAVAARLSTLQHIKKPGTNASNAVRESRKTMGGQAYSAGKTDQRNHRWLRSPCMASPQCTAPTKLRIKAP